MTDNDLPLAFLFLLSGSSSGEQLVTTVRETRRLSSHDVVFHSSFIFRNLRSLCYLSMLLFAYIYHVWVECSIASLTSSHDGVGSRSVCVRISWLNVVYTSYYFCRDFSMDKMSNVIFLFLLFSEIARVRASLFQINGVRKEPLQLPEPDGETVTLNEKVYVPVKEHPDVSFVFLLFVW